MMRANAAADIERHFATLAPNSGRRMAGRFLATSPRLAATGRRARDCRAFPRPSNVRTVVFAANDAMAIGALSAFREVGSRVPEDIAVAGFDDIPMARYMSPPLTSVHVEISELGARAMGVLLAAVQEKNRHERQQVVLPTTLVVRHSCGCG